MIMGRNGKYGWFRPTSIPSSLYVSGVIVDAKCTIFLKAFSVTEVTAFDNLVRSASVLHWLNRSPILFPSICTIAK